MIRLLYLAVAVCLACKFLFGRWPWDYLRPPSTRSQALFRARKLLAVRSDASRAEVLDAHKRLITVVHPDKGGSNSQVHEANAARDLLLDELPDGN
ncbi:MAG: molecular chaperone DnaJ [Novosphingobium sp.]|nr:molecular chaperone DnaJ [Novosphingobium sp.]